MNKNTLEIKPAKTINVSELGVAFSENVTIEDWEQFGEQIGRVVNSSQFIIGDWINFGRDKWDRSEFKRRIAIAEVKTGLDPATIKSYSCHARKIPFENRNPNCSFELHRAVSKLESKEQKRWLKIADDESMNIGRLKASIKAGKSLSIDEFTKPKKEPTHTYDDCLVFVHNIERWFTRKNNLGYFDSLNENALAREIDKLQPIIDAYNILVEKIQAKQKNNS